MAERESEVPPLFVGRDAELGQVLSMLSAASSRLAFVAGEAGIGKTRLVQAIGKAAQCRGLGVLYGRCVEQDGPGEPYLPIFDALRAASEAELASRLSAALRETAPVWSLGLPGITTGTRSQLQRDTLGASRERVQRELADLLEAVARESPVLLVLDDLHWADAASLDLLRHFASRPPARVVVLATYRPSDVEASGHAVKDLVLGTVARGTGQVISLDRLSGAEVQAWLQARFGRPPPGELTRAIHARTEGHPLFLVTLVEHLLERGALVQDPDGAVRVTRPHEEIVLDVPPSVRSLIERTVLRLADSDRKLLQYASVLGGEFLSSVAARLVEIDEVELDERIEALRRVHPIVERLDVQELPDGSLATRYRFAHALYQEALYDSIVVSRRVLLHRRAGEALESVHGRAAEKVAAQLAGHFERGRDFARAARWRLQAGQNASELHAASEAIGYYAMLLPLAERLPDAERETLRATAYLRMAMEQLSTGQYLDGGRSCTLALEQARAANLPDLEWAALSTLGWTYTVAHLIEPATDCARQALDLAQRTGNAFGIAETHALSGYIALGTGDLDEVLRLSSATLAIADAAGAPRARMVATVLSSLVATWRSEYPRAAHEGRLAHDLAVELRDSIFVWGTAFQQSMALGNMGRLAEGVALLTQVIERLDKSGIDYWNAMALNTCGWLWREANEGARAAELDRRSVELARASGNWEALVNARLNQAEGAAALGRIDDEAVGEAQALAAANPWMQWRSNLRVQRILAETGLRTREHGRAVVHARSLVACSARFACAKYEAIGHLVVSEVAALERDAGAAMAAARAAQSLLRDKPVALLDWRVQRALARAHAAADERDAARSAYAAAVVSFRAMADGQAEVSMRKAMLSTPAVLALEEEEAEARS